MSDLYFKFRGRVARFIGYLYQKVEVREDIDHHQSTNKPWGKYIVLHRASNYKIKRLVIRPGQTISLQSHKLRSEHWIIVNGTATIQLGIFIEPVTEGESVFVKAGEKHRITNSGEGQLVIIEVQLGAVDEGDIERFEDIYGRCTNV